MNFLFAFALSSGYHHEPVQPAQSKEKMVRPEIERVIQFLPVDTETLAVVQSPVVGLGNKASNTVSLENWPFCCPDLSQFKPLNSLPAKYLVHGARRFQYPNTIGLGNFQGATILGLDSTNFQKAKSILGKFHLKKTTILGKPAYFYKLFIEKEPRNYYFLLQDSCLVLSTDLDFLKTILNRQNSKPTDRALPSTLDEWKYVDQSSDFWAVRHIDPKHHLTKMGMDMNDPKIQGFTFSISKDGTLNGFSISDSLDGFVRAKAIWDGGESKAHSVMINSRVTQITITKEKLGIGFFYSYVALGYAIAV